MRAAGTERRDPQLSGPVERKLRGRRRIDDVDDCRRLHVHQGKTVPQGQDRPHVARVQSDTIDMKQGSPTSAIVAREAGMRSRSRVEGTLVLSLVSSLVIGCSSGGNTKKRDGAA